MAAMWVTTVSDATRPAQTAARARVNKTLGCVKPANQASTVTTAPSHAAPIAWTCACNTAGTARNASLDSMVCSVGSCVQRTVGVGCVTKARDTAWKAVSSANGGQCVRRPVQSTAAPRLVSSTGERALGLARSASSVSNARRSVRRRVWTVAIAKPATATNATKVSCNSILLLLYRITKWLRIHDLGVTDSVPADSQMRIFTSILPRKDRPTVQKSVPEEVLCRVH
jgi:hypothetical protein